MTSPSQSWMNSTMEVDDVTMSMARDTDVTTGQDVTTLLDVTTTSEQEMDKVFIIAMACFGAGALLVIIALIFIILWCKKTSDIRKKRKQRYRTKAHKRYLKEYSVKTGGAPDEFTPTGSQRSLNSFGSSRGIFTLRNYQKNNNLYFVGGGGGAHSANGSAAGSIKGSDKVLVESEHKHSESELNGEVADVRF